MSQDQREATPGDGSAAARPGRTFVRVMIVQVVTLTVLWLLQSLFGQG